MDDKKFNRVGGPAYIVLLCQNNRRSIPLMHAMNPFGAFSVSFLPAWAVLHLPHDSTLIPAEFRDQFILSDSALDIELLKITDHHTHALLSIGIPSNQVLRFPVSRLVVDVERFELDQDEPMAARGMGFIYTKTHDLSTLRRQLSEKERTYLLTNLYQPHHFELTTMVDQALERFGRALLIDGHSFPAAALPYEVDPTAERPEICIGTDDFHTPEQLVTELKFRFEQAGFTVGINTPFAGALVPLKYYRKDTRVASVMIEIRRDLYMDEATGQVSADFVRVSEAISECTTAGVNAWFAESGIGDLQL